MPSSVSQVCHWRKSVTSISLHPRPSRLLTGPWGARLPPPPPFLSLPSWAWLLLGEPEPPPPNSQPPQAYQQAISLFLLCMQCPIALPGDRAATIPPGVSFSQQVWWAVGAAKAPQKEWGPEWVASTVRGPRAPQCDFPV